MGGGALDFRFPAGGMAVQPGSVVLGEFAYRPAIDEKGAPLYRQRPAPFYPAQVSQGDMGEAQVSPDGRLPFSLRDLSEGGGLAQQPLEGDLLRFDRCGDAEGEGADASLTPAGPVVLAARLETPPTAGQSPDGPLVGVLRHAGYPNLYLSAGRRVFAFDGTATTAIGDLGAGIAATDAITAYQGAMSPASVEVWYQPCGYNTPLRVSLNQGGAWAAVDTLNGVTNVQSAVELDGEVVVALKSPRLGNAMVGVFEDGGVAPTLFNVIDPIGDVAVQISRVLAFNGRILVLKDREGVFLLTDDRRSLEEELFPEFRGERIYYHGVTVWRGLLWLPTSAGLYAIGPNLGLQKVGPMEGETSALAPWAPRGPVVAVAGDAHNLYAFRESTTGPSWVYKAVVEVSGGAVQGIAWFPWSQQADRARSRCMMVGAPGLQMGMGGTGEATRPRLIFGRFLPTGSGTPPVVADTHSFGWFRLPGKGRDPRVDDEYQYAPAGTLYYSRLTARFPAINKAWYSVTPLCAPLELELDGYTETVAQGVRPRWKLDISPPVPGGQPFGYREGVLQRRGVGTRDRLIPPLYGRGFDVGIRLSTSDPATSPQVYSVTIEYDLRPTPVWRHEMTLDLSSGAFSPGGQGGWADPVTPASALRNLRLLCGASGQLQFTDLWGISYDVSVPVDGVALRAAGQGEAGFTGEVPLLVDVVCVEQAVRDQGTWGAVAGYSWQQIAAMKWGDLPQLG